MIEQTRVVTPVSHWYDGLTKKHWQVLQASFLGWIFDGYEAMAIIVVLGPMMHSVLTPAQAASTSIYAGGVIGITLLGWGLGGIVGGVLADYIGRKRMMLWSIFLYALFSGLTALANGFLVLCVLRFLTGLAMGSEWGTGVSLVSETWPDRARAKGLGFLHSGFGWGTLLAASIWYALSSTLPLGDETWRLIFLVGAVPALGVLYLRRGLEESEKWRQAVREKRWNATSNVVRAAASAPAAKDGTRPFTLKLLFTEPEALRRTMLAMILSAVTTVGWWAISSWLPTYTIALGKAEGVTNPVIWGSRVSLTYTVGAIVAYMLSGFIIDVLGRRLFMCLTFVGSLLVTIVTYKLTTSVEGMAVLAPINGFFTLGCAFAWMAIYPVELFTATVRTSAISMIFNGARLVAWIFPIIAGTLIASFGGIANTALIMGSVYVLGIVLPWLLPETIGRKLPE